LGKKCKPKLKKDERLPAHDAPEVIIDKYVEGGRDNFKLIDALIISFQK